MKPPLLELKDTCKQFLLDDCHTIDALRHVSLSVGYGETVGLIGESGCGKSTLARMAMGLYTPDQGDVYFEGMSLRSRQGLQAAQHGMHLIFQDSDGALDPHMTSAQSIREGLRLSGHGREEGRQIDELLHSVGLEPRHGQAYPAELSGGQRQRVAIARCLAVKPKLIIADEPIASLDVSIQAQIINLLMDLQEQQHFSMLFIAHDLAVVRHISHRVVVMYEGRVVEEGPTDRVFSHPGHAYTRRLLASILRPDPLYERNKPSLPHMDDAVMLGGELQEIESGHKVRC